LTQLGDLVRRDRNHPSVIVWSLGNEEVFVQGTAAGARIAARMKQLVRELDPSRPVTLAMNGAWGEGASDIIDILGCNYIGCGDIDMHHKKHPGQPIVFTESASATSTRGIYAVDGQRGYVTAYDRQPAMWGNTHEENWKHCDARPFVAGTFVWTGFDYRGEPTPVYAWPNISSHFGIIDTCGFPKDAFYYYKAWWTDEPVLHLMPHWNWQEREGQPVEVWVYSNCDEVELKLNGRSFGRQAMPHAGHLEWKVPFVSGELTATGWKQGRQTMTTTVRTTGHATGLRLVPDKPQLKADGEDALVVRAEVIDAHGQVVPNAGNEIVFVVQGPAQILGVGNGDPSCHEPDHNNVRSAFNGLCQVIIQSVRKPGRVTLTARADGLAPAVVELETMEVTPRAWMPAQSGEPVSFACSVLQPGNDVASAELPASNLVYAPASPVPATGFYDFRQFHGGKGGLLYIRATYEVFAAGPGALQYGADGPIKLWVNGQLVAVHPTASNPAKKDEYRSRVVWKVGVNEVIIAMTTNGGKAWGLFIKPVLAG
jgi:beta-galactosidase